MRGGKLRYPAEVLREITSQSSTGGEQTEYTSVLKTKVGITTVSGADYIKGGAETMETTVKIVMRTPNERVLMGDHIKAQSRTYIVMGVLEFDNGRSLQLMCKELL